ncbi:MAG TPA: hypothetical protein VFC23_13920 [Thermoanaerobaculia bacterium]|nr:hypothetical protein [Thermoanaerobaculia bacterium]
MGSRTLIRPLHALLFVLPFFAFGCQNGGHMPTEPASSQPQAAVAASSTGQTATATGTAASPTVAASHGNGNGNGNGGSNNGNGNGNGGGDLRFEIQPDAWNTNWAHADGLVQAFVRGGDANKIDTSSVVLLATGGTPISPRSARIAGGQLVASFSKSDAIGLFTNPQPGDSKTVTLRFKVAGQQKELQDQIRIVGAANGGGSGNSALRLDLDPDDWNVSWAHSSGSVHAFLRGSGLKDVDLSSIRLVGDRAGADPVAPTDARLVGNQIAARFAQSAAFATLNDPKPGQTHTVKIRFTQAGAQKELSAKVHVEGRR